MAYPKKVWVKLNRPEGEVNLRDKQGRDIGDIPEGIGLTVLGIDSQGRYIPEAFIASSVCQDTDPNAPAVLNWAWPTEYKVITQKWGARPEYYQQFGLPGHDGVDARAYIGSKLFAVWDGIVTRLDTNPATWGAYGYSIRVRYGWQGDTHEVIYAHGQAGSAKVKVGDRVTRGQWIMNAGNTGNVQGAHLHLGLKVIGKTYTDTYPNGSVRVWPNNLHDPTPYLFPTPEPTPIPYATLPEGHALRGVGGPADPGDWAWTDQNLAAILQSNMQAVLVLVPETSAETIGKLYQRGVKFIGVRLFAKLDERRGNTIPERAEWFANQVRQDAITAYNTGVRYFQVANEVNLKIEGGVGVNWDDGYQFSEWYNIVVSLLRPSMPLARFGFPALSPGDTIEHVRQSEVSFLAQAGTTVDNSDYINVHAYWNPAFNENVDSAIERVRTFCNRYKNKVILLTEWSNNSTSVSKENKAPQYQAFYGGLKTCPPNLGAGFCFVLSATSGFEHETWVEKDGSFSPLVIPY